MRFILVILALLSSSCSTLQFMMQAAEGQLELINRSKPIEKVLKDERTPPKTRVLLTRIPEFKSYGEKMGLKPTRNYENFVQLNRPYVVWVVTACDPLKFKPVVFDFPVAGSFSYQGWFTEEGAKKHAAELKTQGFDVDVRGASAYSTLGWFKDPVLSTMFRPGDPESSVGDLANVILHESVHATFYIKGQSAFNESLASFVADELTPGILKENEKKIWEAQEARGREIHRKFHTAYLELEKLYASTALDAEKLARKSQILTGLQKDASYLREITNATLIQFKTYGTGDTEFRSVYEKCGKSWDCFWGKIKALESKSFAKEQDEDFARVVAGLAS